MQTVQTQTKTNITSTSMQSCIHCGMPLNRKSRGSLVFDCGTREGENPRTGAKQYSISTACSELRRRGDLIKQLIQSDSIPAAEVSTPENF